MARARRAVDLFLSGACIVLFSLLVLVVVWQVISRQVLGTPATWTDEVSRYIFVWVGMFAAALVFSERGHLAVDIVARMAPPAGKRVLGMIGQVAIIVFAVVLLVFGGIRAAAGAWGQGLQTLPFTLGQMYIVMPITGVLIAFYALIELIDLAAGRSQAFSDDVEPEAEKYLDDAPAVTDAATPRTRARSGATSTDTAGRTLDTDDRRN